MIYLEKILSLGLYLLVFLLPLQTRLFIRPGMLNGGYFEYGTISVYGTDILLILVICLFLFYRWQKHKTQSTKPKQNTARLPARQEHKAQTNKLFLLIIGLNLISLVSIFFAADKLVAVQAYVRLTLGMGLFFLVSNAAYDYIKLLYVFLAGATAQALFGIWQFLSQATFANKWLGLAAHPAEVGGTFVIETLGGGRWLRAYGGLDHPNMLGGLMTVAILIGFYLLIRKGKKEVFKVQDTSYNNQTNHKFQITNGLYSFVNWKLDIENCLLLVTCFLCLAALLFTFSRGAWISFAVGLVVILALNLHAQNRQGIRKLIILGASAIVLVGVLFFNYQDLFTTRVFGGTRLEIKSNYERTASYKDGLAIIKEHWLAGAGVGGYAQSLVKFYPNQSSWFYQPTHNVFLLVWAELGIIGLILFVCIFVILINSKSEISMPNKIPSHKIKKGSDSRIGIWKFIGNWDLDVGNSVSGVMSNTRVLKAAILFSLIIMSLVDHYLWSLHFGVLFFWFLLGLAAKIEPQTDLTDSA